MRRGTPQQAALSGAVRSGHTAPRPAVRRMVLAAGLLLPGAVSAHGFGALYNLPVPLWLYGWASAITLLASFLIAGVFLSRPVRPGVGQAIDVSAAGWVRALHWLLPGLRLLAVLVLFLCIATGYLGNRDPTRNFSMIFFWILFLLLVPYLTALLGNFYAALNPWRTLAEGIGRVWGSFTRGRLQYPRWLGDWPALVLYLSFIGFELFGTGRPASLAVGLAAYTLLNLIGVWLVGLHAWFRHCEFFAVFLRLVALLAPVDYQRGDHGERGQLRLRWPCAGLIHERPTQLSTVAFALAMLSTTAFDGLKATQWWVSLFWSDPTGILQHWLGLHPINALAAVRPWFIAWESLWLWASPLLLLGAYLGALWLTRKLTACKRPVRALALDFGYSLLPIAVVYNVTHYISLLLAHGLKIFSVASDPFGWKWDLFGTAQTFRAPVLPDMGVVWHTQVGLIVLGHILSVIVAHRIAIRVFSSRRAAVISQIPMLVLMIGFTIGGLWILAAPLTAILLR